MKPQGRPPTKTPVVNPQTMDRQTFLANLRQSSLLSADQFAKATRKLPENNRAVVVAKALIDQGFLTRFQAEILLHGKTSGFFLGQYKILDHLGRGGMGRVYKAEHQTMNRVVAVKVLASHLVKTPKAQQMFQREVRAAARLVHPNIVTAYDANNIGERCYLVMEFVDGANLEEIVKQHGPLPIGTACDFIRQAAIGLQYAHEMGMVHRDIKPANLLVQRPPARAIHTVCNVKILDFGLARLQSWGPNQANEASLPAPDNAVLGTPDFLSPEQARNLHSVDIRSDLYSLGCSLYFMLTGKVPYPGGTTLEKLVRHSTETPIAIEKLRPDLSPPVANIVQGPACAVSDAGRAGERPGAVLGAESAAFSHAGGDGTVGCAHAIRRQRLDRHHPRPRRRGSGAGHPAAQRHRHAAFHHRHAIGPTGQRRHAGAGAALQAGADCRRRHCRFSDYLRWLDHAPEVSQSRKTDPCVQIDIAKFVTYLVHDHGPSCPWQMLADSLHLAEKERVG
jgi:eukaryotic-like serine/threonine-protein kinase